MNQKRKRLGLWILFLAALLLTQFTVPVKASEPQIQDVNIQMVGGQIRTIDPMGLRYVLEDIYDRYHKPLMICERLPASRNHIFKSWKKAERR